MNDNGTHLQNLRFEAGELVFNSLVFNGGAEQENVGVVDCSSHLLVCNVLRTHNTRHDLRMCTRLASDLGENDKVKD